MACPPVPGASGVINLSKPTSITTSASVMPQRRIDVPDDAVLILRGPDSPKILPLIKITPSHQSFSEKNHGFRTAISGLPLLILKGLLHRVSVNILMGENEMSQSMPEALDYRNLIIKLSRIDSEWESLKGMLTFKGPSRNAEPAKNLAITNKSQADMDNKVVGFPKPSSQIQTQTGCEAVPSTIAVTPRESEALTQRSGKNSHDGTLMERLSKVERQIHKLTLLVTALMTLALALFAVLAFLGIKGNLFNRSAFHQPKEISAPTDPASRGAKVPVNDRQSPVVKEMVSPSEVQSVSKTALPAGDVGKSLETITSPAAPESAPKFVGSKTSNKIHYPDCKWAAKIKPEKLIIFPSITAAREQGYIPCPVCRPHESDETH
jgi:hypothetical protein